MNTINAKFSKPAVAKAPSTRRCPECLSDIPLGARRCMYCTAQVAPQKA
jgi:large conductance mechanosensitive channel